METASGRCLSVCLASNSALFPAANPTRRMRSGRSSATLIVLVPMDPVLPRRTTFFIYDLRFTIYALRDVRAVLADETTIARISSASVISPARRDGLFFIDDLRYTIYALRDVRAVLAEETMIARISSASFISPARRDGLFFIDDLRYTIYALRDVRAVLAEET